MTVKELIKQLLDEDMDAEIEISTITNIRTGTAKTVRIDGLADLTNGTLVIIPEYDLEVKP